MEPSQVTLSTRAQAIARRHGISELQIKRARARNAASYEMPHYVVVYGQLEDATWIRLHCSPAKPEQVLGLEVCV